MLNYQSIKPPTVDVWHGEDYIGNLNEYEFSSLRVKIKQRSIEGCYVYYNKQKIRIDKQGNLEDWPNGMFDHLSNCYLALL